MENNAGFASMPLSRKIIGGASILLLISSFLPWVTVNIAGFGASASGWHGIGVVAWLFAIATIAIEVCRMLGVLKVDDKRANMITLGAVAATVLFTLIFVIMRLSQGFLGFGVFIGIVAMLGLAYGGYLLFRESDAITELKNMQTPPNQGPQAPPHPGPQGPQGGPTA